MEKCCKWHGEEWRSCERHPLLCGTSLAKAKQWTINAKCNGTTRNVPIYLEVSWTCTEA